MPDLSNTMRCREERRDKLRSYELIGDLPTFFARIGNIAKEYQFVSAAERRCMNLAMLFLPDLPNLVSNNGLLLRYKEIVNVIVEELRLPSILITDDIMFHGRGVAKFLYQLERLIYDELKARVLKLEQQLEQEQRDEKLQKKLQALRAISDGVTFRYAFANAIDIYVFARNKRTIYLESRFMQKLNSEHFLYTGELRDMSLQMSDILARWEMANTCYAPSVRLQPLSDLLMRDGDTKIRRAGKDKTWVRVSWKYSGEGMLLYLRIAGRVATRISSVRFFPRRDEYVAAPQMTSFTLLGDLSKAQMDLIIKNMIEILTPDVYPMMCGILSEKHSLLHRSQYLLINYLVSVIDFYDFAADMVPDDDYQAMMAELRDDRKKIARCFGDTEQSSGGGKLRPLFSEFSKFVRDATIREKIKSIIYPKLDEGRPFPLERCGFTTVLPENGFALPDDQINRDNLAAEYILGQVGGEAEKEAIRLESKPFLFRPDLYQEYDPGESSSKPYGEDGIISMAAYIENAGAVRQKIKRKTGESAFENAYTLLAAFVALMDNGILGARIHVPVDGALITSCKAGEMATFYIPKLFSAYIPAFALIERYHFRIGLPKKKAIEQFMGELSEKEITALTKGLNQKEEKETTLLQKHQRILDELPGDIQQLYDCGQSFQGWNFENLTYQSDKLARKFQRFLWDAAKKFLQFPAE